MTRAHTRTIELKDEAATAALGARLAGLLGAGDTVFLIGDLGAGKTTLARAVIAAACGVYDAPSPTYTLVQTYDLADGGLLLHADLYRIEDAAELDELGLDEAFGDAVVLVEWPDRLGARAPDSRLEIALAERAGGGRTASLTGQGEWEGRVEGF